MVELLTDAEALAYGEAIKATAHEGHDCAFYAREGHCSYCARPTEAVRIPMQRYDRGLGRWVS